jgi:hypothetical protein
MLILRASADIEAPIERVHTIMMDFPRYAEWNPFVVGIEGEARVGGVLTLDVRFHDGRRERVRERIEVIEAPGDRAELTYCFLGPFARLGLVRTVRRQVLTRLGEGRTRYETEERFTGLFTAFLPRASIQRGFDDQARALKQRAEGQTPSA